MILAVAWMCAACTSAAPSKMLESAPTDQAACDRSWNPYGDLPAACDVACAVKPQVPALDPRTGKLACDAEPCIDQPACTLAMHREDLPRIDCMATFITADGHRGCCMEIDGGVQVETFYECP